MPELWTGPINDGLGFAAEVGFYDTTLRDGEQTVGVVLSPDDKLEIARLVDSLGVGRIEAGFPRVSDEDREAIRRIADAGLDAEVWGFARAVTADLEALVELGLEASVIESPVSDLKLRALGVSRDAMLDRIARAVSFAVERGVKVAYFGVDGTRADREFLHAAHARAVEAGASEIVVVDTIGVAAPEAVGDLVTEVRDRLGPEVPVHFHGHDDFGLATAAAVAAARAGAAWIHGTVNGMGERAGNAHIAEVALALRALYGVDTPLRLGRAREVSARVAELAGTPLDPWKAAVGETLFTRESGAVASQFHDPEAIEPYSSDLVGAERRIVLGKKSGLDSIRIKLEELGIDVPEERRAELLAAVKRRGTETRGLVGDDEFRRLAESLWMPSTRALLPLLRKQVAEIAAAHGIEIIDGAGRGRAYRGMRERGRRPRVRIPEIRGQVTYFVALHELGHLVARGNRSLPQLEAEAQAWRWALDHALVEPTEHTRARIRTYLRSYYERAVVRRLLGRRVVATIPSAGSDYWRLLAELGDDSPVPGPSGYAPPGSSNANTEPPPARDSTQMRPPIRCTSSWQM